MKKIDSSLAVRKRPGRRALASLESLISLAWLQGVKSWRAGQSSATALLILHKTTLQSTPKSCQSWLSFGESGHRSKGPDSTSEEAGTELLYFEGANPYVFLNSWPKWLSSAIPTRFMTSFTLRNVVSKSLWASRILMVFRYCAGVFPISALNK